MGKRNTDFLASFQLSIFTITYILSALFLYVLVIFLLKNAQPLVYVLISLAFLAIGIILWATLYVLFSVPQKMAGSFDYIKNEISSGVITGTDTFSEKLTDFLTSFYNFAFFDIEYSVVKVKNTEPKFSSPLVNKSLEWEEIENSSSKVPDQVKHGKIIIEDQNFFSYTTPIFFGNLYLGYFTVFSKSRLNFINLQLLSDLESNFIDDQLMLLIKNSNIS